MSAEDMKKEGATEGIHLEWSKIACSISKKKGTTRLLSGVSGEAIPGRILAIVGPSGSGKTTLLNCLAGQLERTKGLALSGEIFVNSEPCNSGMHNINKAYIRQEDVFFSQMTVRETLTFIARLKLPREMPLNEKAGCVEAIMQKLSLTKCADTIVGDTAIGARRGISGGEKKRLSIACELIGEPKLLFVDEPTTGLDSFQALKVMDSLKSLASDGRTVICVIHQPSSAIFNLFDDLCVLSEGRVAYFGVARQAANYFAGLGQPCPANVSPAEHCLDLVSINYESFDTEKASRERVHSLADMFDKPRTACQPPRLQGIAGLVRSNRPQAAMWEQIALLFARSWRQAVRNKVANLIRIAQQTAVAVVYGGIYTLTDSQSSIQDRLGLLSMVAIGNFVQPLASAIRTFPKEKSIVISERSKRLYAVLPYFISKVVAECPLNIALSLLFGSILYPAVGLQPTWRKFVSFLGVTTLHSLTSQSLGLWLSAVAPSSDAALAMMPPVIVLSNLFNGFIVTEEGVPPALRWLPKLSVIRWAWEGLCFNEFEGLKFKCDSVIKTVCVGTGREALARISGCFDKTSLKGVFLAQASILGACYLHTYWALCKAGPKYAIMKPPPYEDRAAEGRK